jgi:hypothetical protein
MQGKIRTEVRTVTAIDALGNTLQVGDIVNVPAKIIGIVDAGGESMLVATTLRTHGPDGKVYSIPTVHGSQVSKA